MSHTFTGFSEADIIKLQNGTQPNKTSEYETKQIKSSLKSKKSKAKESKLKKVIFSSTLSSNSVVLPDEAKLCKIDTTNIVVQRKGDEEAVEEDREQKQTPAEDMSKDNIITERKCIDLEEFQARQKLMEEQNRRRKELLGKALADRTKQTQEEVQRLNEIRNEFKKLDAVLSNDVKILRQQIELASVEYMEAEKKYCKIEKEFLDAKLGLQQKQEKKEMLTEHLCAIIEQNEERKANKLTELLDKLDLKGNMPDIENNDNKLLTEIQISEVTSTDYNYSN